MVPLPAGLQAKDLCALDRRYLDHPALLLHRVSSLGLGTCPTRPTIAADLDAATDAHTYAKLATDADTLAHLHSGYQRDAAAWSQCHIHPHTYALAHANTYAPQHEHANLHPYTNLDPYADRHRHCHSTAYPYINRNPDTNSHRYDGTHAGSDEHQHADQHPDPNLDTDAKPDANPDLDQHTDSLLDADQHTDHDHQLLGRPTMQERYSTAGSPISVERAV
ncbi:MAG: hypothetical protein PVI80_09510 [Anaerolineae bacterium]|jgi:hypothetical protein